MRQHSGGQMYTHTTKEEQTRIIKPSHQSHRQPNAKKEERKNSQEWNPSQILKQSCEEIPLSQPNLQKSITQIPNTRKNNGTSEENLETM